ncbi:MAG: OsmC family peroxiredoxin [Chloroflexota bacterium]|nr:OsmC family peroxiredoxin [Chloroflexota bacterium]
MPARHAHAQWNGNLNEGNGTVKVGSGAFEGAYSFNSRFGEGDPQVNPEELLGAAHAGCFSMALAARLSREGHTVNYVRTTAMVHLDKGDSGFGISKIDLVTEGSVDGVTAEYFAQAADETKSGCIISRALASVPMTISATLA